MTDRCFFFGSWNGPGLHLWAPGGKSPGTDQPEWFNKSPQFKSHLDNSLAPRRSKRTRELCWIAQGPTEEDQQRIGYDSEEYPQGQFLRHELDNGFTVIQWWDRQQHDKRSGINSTILLEGRHTTDEMLAALSHHFPHVLKNLTQGNVGLVEVAYSAAR